MSVDSDVIIVPEATAKTLQNLAQQIGVLRGYMQVVGETVINMKGTDGGNYQFSADFKQLIRQQQPACQ